MSRIKWLVVFIAIAAVGGFFYYRSSGTAADSDTSDQGSARAGATPSAGQRGGRGGGPGAAAGGGRGGMARPPMPVELAAASRADISVSMGVVGNLIGASTVEVLPKVAGRLSGVSVRLGDRVSRGQPLAKIEDNEIVEQVKQAEASFNVAEATVRQREADLRFSDTNLARSRSLFDRELMSRQSMDDAEARSAASTAQLDLARAQFEQTKARVEELRINLANTLIRSPVDGFVGKRILDPGAWVTTNSSFMSVVDIGVVRLVANVAEKDLQHITAGTEAHVQVDAYSGEVFPGRVARVAPVLDPATRTAQIEVEVPNRDFRLKPGMYARVEFITEQRQKALVVPTSAVVNVQGQSGVFLPGEGSIAKFQVVATGLVDGERTEIRQGLQDGDRVITTGAGALQDGDRILLVAEGQGPGGSGRGGRGRGSAQAGAAQPFTNASGRGSASARPPQ
jgi:membrane fusion protein (multidrug efflux system)